MWQWRLWRNSTQCYTPKEIACIMLFDPARSNFDDLAFWCNESVHHNLLGESCFRVMKSALRFNMGDIESSFLFDSDNEALSEKVNDISVLF